MKFWRNLAQSGATWKPSGWVRWAFGRAATRISPTAERYRTGDGFQRPFPSFRASWGPKYALTESVNRLTHPVKTPKNAHNTRFFQLARSDRAGRSVALGPEIRGRTALALRLSLRHNPLVNKRADRRRDYWRAPLLWRTPRWITKKSITVFLASRAPWSAAGSARRQP
jgi:hypothetical protein